MKKLMLLGSLLLLVELPASAAVITRTADFDLETAVLVAPPQVWAFYAEFMVNPHVPLMPGDTFELDITFQNGQRLRLQDSGVPVTASPDCYPQFYMEPTPGGGSASMEAEFVGVTGSLLANPATAPGPCMPDACYGHTPDLTDTSFEFDEIRLKITFPQVTRSIVAVTLACTAPDGGGISIEGPIPVDPPQTVPTGGVPVEYSNDVDEAVAFTGSISLEMHGSPDPGQTIYAEPVDFPGNLLPDNGLDFFPAVESGTELTQQVDALAYGTDAYLADLFVGEADLMFSVTGDGAGQEWALLREETDGHLSVEYVHQDLVAGDAPGGLDDVDAAELWGDLGALDARYYSLQADAASGTSIWVQIGGSPAAWVSHADILAAVTSLGYAGEPDQVDVDGLMVRNAGEVTRFDTGDVLLFSIRATPDGNFDGGEIIELRPGQPAKFLDHGGHLWDTAFNLTARLSPLNGGADPPGSEDVDALEATLAAYLVGLVVGRVPDGSGPEPPLDVALEPSGDLTLSWGVSCAATDIDYEVYEGAIGSYYSHSHVACTTGGLTTITIPAPAGDAYYLVVPTNGVDEGSYGSDSGGAERPQGLPFCRPAMFPQCGQGPQN